MAAHCNGVFSNSFEKKIKECKILIVGAGGIGCEIIKNLVLTGFTDIELIDLDTIDVSNLNRQFLFRKQHIGKSKAVVARETCINFNPNVKITAHHDSVMSSQFGIPYIKRFNVVMNALDNRAARNHVNRMCLAADVPLIESGTEGYLGSVIFIKKGMTECYECLPVQEQKTYPGCTIRNTPSEPIHCVIWAKHLFNQLFGEVDEFQDVSPDTDDPELVAIAARTSLNSSYSAVSSGLPERKSTRLWASECGYEPIKIFNKIFRDDIEYLLSMENLWLERVPPKPLHWDLLDELFENSDGDVQSSTLMDQMILSIPETANQFYYCVKHLKDDLEKQGEGGILVWNKDDDVAMDFVTCASNIRSHIFGIPRKSRFEIKSMAGNIVPAIATTNAIIAGLVVMKAFHILNADYKKCKTAILNKEPTAAKKLISQMDILPPNPKCYVCASKPELTLILDVENFTVKSLIDDVLKSHLGLLAPDVEIDDGKGSILVSSEDGETKENEEMPLCTFAITDGSRLKCEDFHRDYKLILNILQCVDLKGDATFEVVGDLEEFKSKLREQIKKNVEPVASTSSSLVVEFDDDDLIMEDDSGEEEGAPAVSINRKRRINKDTDQTLIKKSRVSVAEANNK